MNFLIVAALAFATVLAKDLNSRSNEAPVLENEGRVVNGKNAVSGQFYYQAGIWILEGSVDLWCSGSFIGNTWILTAAHCVAGFSSAAVYLGSIKRLAAEKSYNVSKRNLIAHPDWNPNTLRNDIGLIRIPKTSENDKIAIVRIPSNNGDKYLGDIVVIAGWGYMSDRSKVIVNYLQYATLEVYPEIYCTRPYRLYYKLETNICVGTPHLVSPCVGDSGGALVLDGQNLQIGVFSFYGQRGCEVGLPVVFTRVSAYLPWIKSKTGIDY